MKVESELNVSMLVAKGETIKCENRDRFLRSPRAIKCGIKNKYDYYNTSWIIYIKRGTLNFCTTT